MAAKWLVVTDDGKRNLFVLYHGPDKRKARQVVAGYLAENEHAEVLVNRVTATARLTEKSLDAVLPRDAF